ncbi:MAG TPA: MXAN_6640 family putative metalloprotease, partial [Gracilimonas sp.]|uniref:MXAN_6640 family putative metalloprotease n=1 Tax=Gracilimonas sp. TaxID=1974203 RepID=UPI002D92F935|nr:MXAN_6640 family putative metalloprotease [Gracilimonas sp.]
SKIENYEAVRLSSKSKLAEESYISPSGKFEIIYQTSGPDSVSQTDNDGNGVPDYIDRVAEAADSSYRHEVLNIGFADPIPSGATYKVYVENDLPRDAYGYTDPSMSSPGGTFIVIESDFNGFPPNTHPDGNQIGAIYATMAHEFKHAIQYVQNNWQGQSGSINWTEMDATLMEEVVYDDVNDYYNYIKNGLYSENPNYNSIFFNPNNGTPGAYWHVSWMIFYSEAFGNGLFRDVWELIEVQNDLSIDEGLTSVLPNYGSDFATTFVQNHLWHFASGPRAGDDDYGFGEKDFYPYSNIEASFLSVPEAEINISSVNRLAARYYEVTPSANDYGSIDVAVDFDSTQVGLGLILYKKDGEMLELLDTGENKGQVYLPSNVDWTEIEKMGVVVTNHGKDTQTRNLTLQFGKAGNPISIRDPKYVDLPDSYQVYQNYPNPFNLTTNINFELPRRSFVELEVYDMIGRKVQTLANENLEVGFYSIPFNARGLSSGVYIYRLRIDEMVYTKKMTLVK